MYKKYGMAPKDISSEKTTRIERCSSAARQLMTNKPQPSIIRTHIAKVVCSAQQNSKMRASAMSEIIKRIKKPIRKLKDAKPLDLIDILIIRSSPTMWPSGATLSRVQLQPWVSYVKGCSHFQRAASFFTVRNSGGALRSWDGLKGSSTISRQALSIRVPFSDQYGA